MNECVPVYVCNREREWSLTVGWPMSNSRMFSWPSTVLSSEVLGLPEGKKGHMPKAGRQKI